MRKQHPLGRGAERTNGTKKYFDDREKVNL